VVVRPDLILNFEPSPTTEDVMNLVNKNGDSMAWQFSADLDGDWERFFDRGGGGLLNGNDNGKSTTTPSTKDFNPIVKPGETPFLDYHGSGGTTTKPKPDLPDAKEEKASIDPLLIAAMAVAAFSLK
jgi:hypothetical protein